MSTINVTPQGTVGKASARLAGKRPTEAQDTAGVPLMCDPDRRLTRERGSFFDQWTLDEAIDFAVAPGVVHRRL